MAVPAYLRQQSKAKFVTVAVRLASWTLKWCKDERLFTRRERWIVTGDIWDSAKRVLLHVKVANSYPNPEKAHDYAIRVERLTAAMDALTELKMLLTIKYHAVMQGFDAPEAQPDAAAQAAKETPKEATAGQPSGKKSRRGGRKKLTQDDIDCIFEIFFDLAIEEQELIKGVMRSDAARRDSKRPV